MQNLALSAFAGNYLLHVCSVRLVVTEKRIVEMWHVKSGGGLATAPTEPRHGKRDLTAYANSKGSDKPCASVQSHQNLCCSRM